MGVGVDGGIRIPVPLNIVLSIASYTNPFLLLPLFTTFVYPKTQLA